LIFLKSGYIKFLSYTDPSITTEEILSGR